MPHAKSSNGPKGKYVGAQQHRQAPLHPPAKVDEAYLFGSWGRGDADTYSDIDLIIVAPSRRPFVERFRDYPELWRGAPTGIDLLIYTPHEFATQKRVNRFVRHVLRKARGLSKMLLRELARRS
jgi:predicted nucleotidyltransferase